MCSSSRTRSLTLQQWGLLVCARCQAVCQLQCPSTFGPSAAKILHSPSKHETAQVVKLCTKSRSGHLFTVSASPLSSFLQAITMLHIITSPFNWISSAILRQRAYTHSCHLVIILTTTREQSDFGLHERLIQTSCCIVLVL